MEFAKQESNIHFMEYICEKLTSVQVGISSLESAVISVENQLSSSKIATDKMDKQLKIIELKLAILEKQIVTSDYLEYKFEEFSEYAEDEYSLLFDDLQVIKKEIIDLNMKCKSNT